MTVLRDKIVQFCRDYLKADEFRDFCHNGLQVEGAAKVSRIVTGVSFSVALVEAALKRRAGMIMVHHGIFSKNLGTPPVIRGYWKRRLQLLLSNNINLCGFHLPLDAHPAIGNNASLLKILGLKKTEAINSPEHGEIGFIGEYQEPLGWPEFRDRVAGRLGGVKYAIPAGPKKVRRVGIISGGASPDFAAAAALGADTYLCGDIRESVVRAVEETGINFVHAGHYHTEVFGIRNLGELVGKKFGVKAEFIDIPCDV